MISQEFTVHPEEKHRWSPRVIVLRQLKTRKDATTVFPDVLIDCGYLGEYRSSNRVKLLASLYWGHIFTQTLTEQLIPASPPWKGLSSKIEKEAFWRITVHYMLQGQAPQRWVELYL